MNALPPPLAGGLVAPQVPRRGPAGLQQEHAARWQRAQAVAGGVPLRPQTTAASYDQIAAAWASGLISQQANVTSVPTAAVGSQNGPRASAPPTPPSPADAWSSASLVRGG